MDNLSSDVLMGSGAGVDSGVCIYIYFLIYLKKGIIIRYCK